MYLSELKMHIQYFQRMRLKCQLDIKVTNQFTIDQRHKTRTQKKKHTHTHKTPETKIIIFSKLLKCIEFD